MTFDQCLDMIRQHPASFVQEFPDRQVNNIYLDDPGLRFFHENIAGVSERKKYRIRWYGDRFTDMVQPVLEIKIKENQLGTKKSVKIQPFSIDEIKDNVEYLIRSDLIPPQLTAVSSNSYLRSYYISIDKRFRITIDRILTFGTFLYDMGIPKLATEEIVIELKYDFEQESEADHIRQYLPFQRTRFSKYVYGIVKFLY